MHADISKLLARDLKEKTFLERTGMLHLLKLFEINYLDTPEGWKGMKIKHVLTNEVLGRSVDKRRVKIR